MHYQVIVEFAYLNPQEVADDPEAQPALGYIQTFGVNAPDHAAAIGKVQDWIKREEDVEGAIAGVDSDNVELEDWPDEVREEFTGDPAKLGVYFATGRVNYGAEDEEFLDEDEDEDQ